MCSPLQDESSTQTDGRNATITVEQGLLTGDHTGTAAWLVDGGTRLLRQREKFKKEPVAECCLD